MAGFDITTRGEPIYPNKIWWVDNSSTGINEMTLGMPHTAKVCIWCKREHQSSTQPCSGCGGSGTQRR